MVLNRSCRGSDLAMAAKPLGLGHAQHLGEHCPAQNAIIRLNTRGDESPEVINGRRNFLITTEERLIT
jgi:hypothetical protein